MSILDHNYVYRNILTIVLLLYIIVISQTICHCMCVFYTSSSKNSFLVICIFGRTRNLHDNDFQK